jgi:hypothetical protein
VAVVTPDLGPARVLTPTDCVVRAAGGHSGAGGRDWRDGFLVWILSDVCMNPDALRGIAAMPAGWRGYRV